MKMLSFIISLFAVLITTSCFNRDEPQLPSDDTDTNSATTPVELVLLEKYSWKACKYYIRLSDSSLYDASEEFLAETCDTSIFTFYEDHSFIERRLCENNPMVEYWLYNPDSLKIHIFFDKELTDYDHSYKIEKITQDSLKLFFISPDNPDELVSGLLIYLYSIPKENN